jgi:hypothetical protein
MAEYQLTQTGMILHTVITETEAGFVTRVDTIPADPANSEYQHYLAWDAIPGNTADPADPLPVQKQGYTVVRIEDIRTSDATVFTFASWPLEEKTLYTARFTIMAVDTVSGACHVWYGKASAKRLTANAILVGTPNIDTDHPDAAAAGWLVAVDVSSTNFRIRVTGAAGRTISWNLVGEVLRARPDGLVD